MTQSIQVEKIILDEESQSREEIDNDTVNEYRLDMLQGDEFPPITVFDDGKGYWLSDGFHRVYAALQCGIKEIKADVKEGGRRDAILHSLGANAKHGKRRTNADKRRVVVKMLNDPEWAIWPQTKIAKHCGVSVEYVSRVKNNDASIDRSIDRSISSVNRNGETYTMQTANIGQGGNGRYQQEIEYDETDTPSGYFEDDYGEPYTVAKQHASQTPGIMSSGGNNGVDMVTSNGRNVSALMSSASDEWYTTPDILEAVKKVMGRIDLDPASSEKANETVSASVFFSKEDDGLSREWWGRVYVNPPYGNEIPKWVDKINAEYEAGNIGQLVLLVPSRTDTRWFRALKEYPRCFMHGRVKFNGHDNSAPFPTMLVGVGVNVGKFTEVMENLGDVYVWHTNSKSS